MEVSQNSNLFLLYFLSEKRMNDKNCQLAQLRGRNFIVITDWFLGIWKTGYRTQNYITSFIKTFHILFLGVSPLGKPKNSLRLIVSQTRDDHGPEPEPDFDLFWPDRIGAGLGFSSGSEPDWSRIRVGL